MAAHRLRVAGLRYRSKARLGVRHVKKHDEVLVGIRERYSNFLTRMEHCPILLPGIGQRLMALRELIRGLSCFDRIPQLEVACGDDVSAIILRHMEPLTESDHGKLIAFAKETGIAMYLQPKGPDSIHKFWPEDGQMFLHYDLSDSGLSFAFHPSDFTQVNREINQMMVSQTLDWLALESGDRVLNLFCGLGNFTLPSARKAHAVVGVEGSQAMV